MSRLFEPNGDRYDDHYDAPRRNHRGCACGLDGFPGTCPGAESCPYSGINDHDESEDDDAA